MKPKTQNKIKAKYSGESHGNGHFALAKTRTFLLCVDMRFSGVFVARAKKERAAHFSG
jgi:hypothetical protein